jgi:diacylglycerol kinase family enzyme
LTTATKAPRATSLLILSSKAGSMTPAAEAKLRRAFEGSLIVEFDPDMDVKKLVEPAGTVVVAGGDGTVGWVVRRLVDTDHPLGIISLGTFNNFARSLNLPTTVDAAIRVIKDGRPRPITLGRLNDSVFLEAAAIGLFGETIVAGEAAKDRAFGDFAQGAMRVLEAKPFKYELSGDINGHGSTMSLVFTNTSSIGSQLSVSDKTPHDPYLELAFYAAWTRTEIVKRVIASALPSSKNGPAGFGQMFRFKHLRVTTAPRVRTYTDNERVGSTPVEIVAQVSALKVIVPR